MKILIFGASGMVGHRLWLDLGAEHEVWGTLRSLDSVSGRSEFDLEKACWPVDVLSKPDVEKAVLDVSPDVVINCAGLIKQRPEADDPLLSLQLNSVFPHVLRGTCQKVGARLIQLSTDCVFSGVRGPYRESDTPDAVDLYGRTKLLGEVVSANTISIRTSFIGRELRGNLSLLEWFLSHDGPVRGFRKAFFSGLTTQEFSKVLLEYVIPNESLLGIKHIGGPRISKFELLALIKHGYGIQTEIIPDDEFVIDRSLATEIFENETGYSPPDWKTMIGEMAIESLAHEG